MNGGVDAHCHVWDLAVRDQPWIVGDELAPLRGRFHVEDLLTEAAANGVQSVVLVQTVADIAETEELLDLADATPSVDGVVGYVELAASDVGDQLDRLLERPTGPWLVGVRSLVQNEPDPGWLVRPAVISGLQEVARRGLTFDLLVRPHQLDTAADAVGMVPDGRFVLDHLAKPDIAGRAWEPWAAGLASLARFDNVWAKLSGLVTEASWTAWSAADLRPYADHALTTFGPERLLFGSDWPVCTLAASYRQVVAVVDDLLDGLSVNETKRILGDTAAGVYGRAR